MPLRRALIERVPFAPIGLSLSDNEVDRKKSELMQDFLTNCPCAKHLSSSELRTAQLPTTTGFQLEFWLCENDQMSLQLPSHKGAKGAALVSDGFANEVAAARTACADSARRLNRAVSPTRTIDEIRDETEFGIQLRELRGRVKSSRPFYVFGTPFQPALADVDAAVFQPQGIAARIKAKVASLPPGRAVLRDIELLEPVAVDLIGAIFPKTIGMVRPTSDKDLETCVALMTAMDAGVIIALDVAVCLDWASAQPANLEYRGMSAPGGE